MELRLFAEVSPLHLERKAWERLVDVMTSGPSSPLAGVYDPNNPWHHLIGDPTRYGCFLWAGLDRAVLAALPDQLPASLVTIVDAALTASADYVLFDADVAPTSDWPVFDHDAAGGTPVSDTVPGPMRV
jgi:hypothetical protein